MAGHVHYRLGDHERAIRMFSRAAAADERFAKTENVAPALNWNYAHNLRYLIAACAAAGRYEEARRWAARLPAGGDAPERLSGMVMVTDPADAQFDLALRLGLWSRAIELAGSSGSAYAKSMTHYAAGMAALDAAGMAALDVAGMGALDAAGMGALDAAGMAALDDDELPRAEAATQALEASAWRLSIASDDANAADLLTLVSIAALELRGRLLIASKDAGGGIRLLLRARQRERELRNYDPPPYPHPTAITLANAYAAIGQHDLAAETLDDLVRDEPSRAAPALLALARLHHTRGNAEQTANAIRRFRAVWKGADRELPHFALADRLTR